MWKGTWMACLVGHLTLETCPGHDLYTHGAVPCVGLCADSAEPSWGSLALSLSPVCVRSCSLSKPKTKLKKQNRLLALLPISSLWRAGTPVARLSALGLWPLGSGGPRRRCRLSLVQVYSPVTVLFASPPAPRARRTALGSAAPVASTFVYSGADSSAPFLPPACPHPRDFQVPKDSLGGYTVDTVKPRALLSSQGPASLFHYWFPLIKISSVAFV